MLLQSSLTLRDNNRRYLIGRCFQILLLWKLGYDGNSEQLAFYVGLRTNFINIWYDIKTGQNFSLKM